MTELKDTVKELEADTRKAENAFQRLRAEFASTQDEWTKQLKEIAKKRIQLDDELKAVDKMTARLKRLDVVFLPEKVEEEKADIQGEIDVQKEKYLDVAAQAQTELDPLAEKVNEAAKPLEALKAELAAAKRYEKTLVK